MTPAVLASMWKEEEARIKALEDKMSVYLREKKVSLWYESCIYVILEGLIVCVKGIRVKHCFGSRVLQMNSKHKF